MCSQIEIPGQPYELPHRNQNRRTFVFDQENDKFGRFGIAGIAANDVNIAGAFIEGLSGCQGDRFSTFYLHHDEWDPKRQTDIRL